MTPKSHTKLVQLLQSHVERAVESRDALLRVLIDEREKASLARFSAERLLTQQALDSIQTATVKAEMYTDNRFASVNELRGALLDAQANFPQRLEVQALLQAQEGKINNCDKLIGALQLSAATLVTQAQHDDLISQISVLRDAINQNTGRVGQAQVSSLSSQWGTGLLVGGGIALAGVVIAMVNLLISAGVLK